MGRQERVLDDGPLRDFAQGLRDLRVAAGSPTYRALARRAGFSASALSAAAGGDRLPTLDVTLAYVGACGGDAGAWEARWQELAVRLQPTERPPRDEPAPPDEPDRERSADGSPAAEPLTPFDPAVVGPFALRGRLGSGAMGQVYLGRTPAGRPVAVKVIHPALAGMPEFRRRFARELEAAGRVRSLFTAALVDADAHAEQPWIATEYVPGPTLMQRLRDSGPLPAREAAALAAEIAEALAAIHAAGLVHRDLKPSNVILAEDGPRVIDFGVAFHADASELSTDHGLLGAVPFTAPEIALGRPPTPAADVFSLGCLIVYALTGAPPFGEDSAAAVLYRIAHEEPDLTALTSADNELGQLVARCLDKNPDARPAPAEIIARSRPAGGDAWTPQPVAVVTADRQRRSMRRLGTRSRLALLALAAAIATVAGVLASGSTPASRPRAGGGTMTTTTATSGAATSAAAPSTPPTSTRSPSDPGRSSTSTTTGGVTEVGGVQAASGATRGAGTTTNAAGGGVAPAQQSTGGPRTWTATVGPTCGSMIRSGYWYQIQGSGTAGCGDGYWHKQSGDGSTTDWIFAPGAGMTCSFSLIVANSSEITSKTAEYELFDGAGGSTELSHTYVDQADHLGGSFVWSPGIATTGTYDLRLYDHYKNTSGGDETREYAGSVAATCG